MSQVFFLTKELSYHSIVSDGLYLSNEKRDRSGKLYLCGEHFGALILSLPCSPTVCSTAAGLQPFPSGQQLRPPLR